VGQHGSGKRWRGRWRARGAERSGAGAIGAQEMAGEGGGVTGASRAGGTGGRRRRTGLEFSKNAGTPL
jgi:hypothetical protein